MRHLSLCLAVLATTTLPGCAGAVIGAAVAARTAMEPIPITSVMRWDDGQEFVFAGQLAINPDGSSRVVMANADESVTCAGAISRRGQGEMVCTGQMVTPINIPRDQFGQFHGAYVDRQPTYNLADGWGDRSDAAALRAML
jgi:hypothetical protein